MGGGSATAGVRVVSIRDNGATMESRMEYPVDMEREDMKLPEVSNVITPEQMYAAHGGSEDTDCEAALAPDGSYVSFTSTSTDPHGKAPVPFGTGALQARRCGHLIAEGLTNRGRSAIIMVKSTVGGQSDGASSTDRRRYR